MVMIKLESNEGKIFKVDEEIMKCSTIITYLLGELDLDDLEDVIPLPNISSNILKKVIKWAIHDNDDDSSSSGQIIQGVNSDNYISPWEANFFFDSSGVLLELILAGQYLGIQRLFDEGCKMAAIWIHDREPDEIRSIFELNDDIPPEEQQEIRQKHT